MSNLRFPQKSVNPQVDNSPKPPNGIAWGSDLSISLFQSLDTLHLGLFIKWPNNPLFLDHLDKYQSKAQEVDKPIPFQIEQSNLFIIHPRGRRGGGYKWKLSAGDQVLFFSTHDGNGETPNLFIEIGSLSCWSLGYEAVIQAITSFVESLGGYVFNEKINRLDMATDIVGLNFNDVNLIDKSRWIKKPQNFNIHGSGNTYNSVNIGMGGQYALRMYDKKAEISKKLPKKEFFFNKWGLPLDDIATSVLRIESQTRKKGLRQFGIVRIKDISYKLNGLWNYYTTNWFRIAEEPVHRTHQSKAETDSFWKYVQSIKWSGIDEIKRQKLPCLKSEKIFLDMIFGCGLNLAAINKIPAHSLDEINRYILYLLEVEFRARRHQDPEDFKRRYETKLAETWGMEF